MTGTIVDGKLVADPKAGPRESVLASQTSAPSAMDDLRLFREVILQKTGSEEVAGAFDKCRELADRATLSLTEAKEAGTLTEKGLLGRHKTLFASAYEHAETLEQRADRMEKDITAQTDGAWDSVKYTKMDSYKYLKFKDIREKLGTRMAADQHRILLTAAAEGRTDVLRAVLTEYHLPGEQNPLDGPLLWADQSTPQGLTLRQAIELAVRARVSPQGNMAFEAMTYRQLAKKVRKAADEARDSISRK